MPLRKLRILVAPYFPENPYQRELQEALRLQGVAVSNATLAADMLEFRRRYRYMRPHILHLHWPDKYCMDDSIVGAIGKTIRFVRDLEYIRASGTKIVWTIHNLLNHERRHRVLERYLQHWLAKNCSAFIAHSNAAKQKAIAKFGIASKKPFWVLPIGNSLTTYPNTQTREEARAALGIPPDRFVFTFFGRIQEYKGVDDLIRAFHKAPELADCQLVIAGKPDDDAYGRSIRQLCAGRANVQTDFEHVADDRIQTFMNAADVVVTPYRRVLTSSASMLAMTFGKPIIGPDFPEFREGVGDAGAIFYRPGDRVDLGRALVEARSRGAELAAMGAANLQAAREADWNRIAARTTKLYLSLRKKNVFLRPPATVPGGGQRIIPT